MSEEHTETHRQGLSFWSQLELGLAFYFFSIVLGFVLNQPIFPSLGFVFFWLLYLVNPVLPDGVTEVATVKKWLRIVSVVMLSYPVISLFSLFK